MNYFNDCLQKHVFDAKKKSHCDVPFMYPKYMFEENTDKNHLWGLYVYLLIIQTFSPPN